MDPESPESADHSITEWISRLRTGEEAAAEAIWNQFFGRACSLARARLGVSARRDRDEEDIAISAMNALVCGAQSGRFRKLENRSDLWQILAMITVRRVIDVQRDLGRRREVGESSLNSTERPPRGLDQMADSLTEREFVDSLWLEADEMISRLEPKLRPIALKKLEGFTNEEIAAQQGRSVATIERYLKRIRLCWQDHDVEAH